MDKLEAIERKAVGLVRNAGRYGVYLTHLGFEVAGLADWLEEQIPRARKTIHAAANAAMDAAASELRGRARDGETGDSGGNG